MQGEVIQMVSRVDEELRLWGQNIRRRRDIFGWSQVDLASKFDPPISQSTVARWEMGLMEPRREHKRRLAEILGVDALTLFPMTRGAA